MKPTVVLAVLLFSVGLILPAPARGDELSESYYPLKEGLKWRYRVMSTQGDTMQLLITNLARREVQGAQVTPRKWEAGGRSFIELMEKNDNGIYRLGEQTGENAAPRMLTPKEWHLKFPVTQGAGWKMTTMMDKEPVNISLTIDSVADEVRVPAGTFKDCVKIRQVSDPGGAVEVLGYEWYAPQVGIVKSMVTMKKKGKDGAVISETRTYELESFQP
jgi:hypothetical protein